MFALLLYRYRIFIKTLYIDVVPPMSFGRSRITQDSKEKQGYSIDVAKNSVPKSPLEEGPF